MPSLEVLTLASTPLLQYCLKNNGKKPAMTVVAKAELAKSYSAQARTWGSRKRPVLRRMRVVMAEICVTWLSLLLVNLLVNQAAQKNLSLFYL